MSSAARDRLFEHLTSKTTHSSTTYRPWQHHITLRPTTLLSYHQIPKYCQDNPHILTGYRPCTSSTTACIGSWFYLHNESMNIYTHALPCLLFAIIQTSISSYLTTYYPQASARDHLAFGFFLGCIVACFGISTLYHTMIAHSHRMESACLRADFVGIVLQIVGAFMASLRMGFWCEVGLQDAYGFMILGLGITSIAFVTHPRFQGLRWRSWRLATFVATAMSGFVPVIHELTVFGLAETWNQTGLLYYMIESCLYACATFFYVTRFPESLKPGRFDIFFSSHQIFHVLIALAAVSHFLGLLSAFDYNYRYRVCSVG